ncbi:hypothetical protein IJG96_01010 [Candidatus Saccharibacteria bacterium]|nr:hypothetical protein [Candidatus Saccharibacteria bacterium]
MDPMNPADKIDQVAGTKPKKHLPKKAKLALIISAAVLAAAGIVVALFLFVFKHEEPEIVLTDRDYLIAHAWEKQGAPTVIWTFRTDGSGEITTNKQNYYSMKWSLEQDTLLSIKTDWLYELNNSFDFAYDKDSDSFTVKNKDDETESVFVPLGTSETQPEEPTKELEKTEE